EKTKTKERARKKAEERNAYLKSIGLEREESICLTILRMIFAEKIINEHFPKPFMTVFSAYLSHAYQCANPEYMAKKYLLADVIEKINAGVPSRIKESLPDFYKNLLLPIVLNAQLSKKEVKTKRMKI